MQMLKAVQDFTLYSDESVDDLVDHMHQMASQCRVFNGSDTAIKYKVQHRLTMV